MHWTTRLMRISLVDEHCMRLWACKPNLHVLIDTLSIKTYSTATGTIPMEQPRVKFFQDHHPKSSVDILPSFVTMEKNNSKRTCKDVMVSRWQNIQFWVNYGTHFKHYKTKHSRAKVTFGLLKKGFHSPKQNVYNSTAVVKHFKMLIITLTVCCISHSVPEQCSVQTNN